MIQSTSTEEKSKFQTGTVDLHITDIVSSVQELTRGVASNRGRGGFAGTGRQGHVS